MKKSLLIACLILLAIGLFFGCTEDGGGSTGGDSADGDQDYPADLCENVNCSPGTCMETESGPMCDCPEGYYRFGFTQCLPVGSLVDGDATDGDTVDTVGTCSPAYEGQDCDRCSEKAFGRFPYCFYPNDSYCFANFCLPITTTGQTYCYDNDNVGDCAGEASSSECATTPLCGQDAQYGQSQRAFERRTIGGGPVVVDHDTGLMWESESADRILTWSEAIEYCRTTSTAGYDDWRLPKAHELRLIFNFGLGCGNNPDSAYFEYSNNFCYWSSNSFAWVSQEAWLVILGDTATADKEETDMTICQGKNGNVLCVRGGVDRGDNYDGSRFHTIDNIPEEPVIYDALTDLVWTPETAREYIWGEALAYCEGLEYGGARNWRLPDVNELFTLVNFRKFQPATDFPVSHDTPVFWSSTSEHGAPFRAKYVYVGWGEGSYGDKERDLQILCITDGQSFPLGE